MSSRPSQVRRVRFGAQRLVRPDVSSSARLLYRVMGAADPAHWLHARILKDALRRHPVQDPRAILDAGCGRGDYSFYLAQLYPGARVLGVDVDAALIERNRETARLLGLENVRFETADLSQLSEHGTFDLVVCVDVLEHIPAQNAALVNLTRALKAGGLAFYHIPTVRPRPVLFARHLGAFSAWADREHVADDLTAEEFCGRVTAAGLEIVEMRRTFGRYRGELATSVFALFFADTPLNRIAQGLVAPLCRALAMTDAADLGDTRYAVAVISRKPAVEMLPLDSIGAQVRKHSGQG